MPGDPCSLYQFRRPPQAAVTSCATVVKPTNMLRAVQTKTIYSTIETLGQASTNDLGSRTNFVFGW